MGIGCKPTGKMRSVLQKIKNQQEKEMKENAKRPAKPKKNREEN